MSGVWVFRNGVVKLIERPTREQLEGADARGGVVAAAGRATVLVHATSGQVVRSHEELARHLAELGWERYYGCGGVGEDKWQRPGSEQLIQYHRRDGSVDLITLPRRFSDVRSIHMYDIAVKNRFSFLVRDRLPADQS